MLRTTALAAALAVSTSAWAIGGEASFELGTLRNGDPAYDLFSERNGLPSRGLRLGVSPVDRLTVQAGWHRVRRGAVVGTGAGAYRTAFFADEFTVGVKGDLDVAEVFYPYVSAHAMVFRGVMKLDDDPDVDDNPGQIQATSVAPGGLFMGGFELRNPTPNDFPLQLALFVEAGYGLVGRGTYGELGGMRPGGFAMRGGIGLRI